MKKFLLTLTALAALVPILGAQELKILVPRTLSALPALELNNQVIAGQTVKVEIFDDHGLALAALTAGKTDLLLTGFSTGLGRWVGEKDVKLVATPVWGVSSVVTLDPGIKSINDLEGKSIVVPFAGSPLDIQLRVLLKAAALEDKVRISYAPLPQQGPLLLQKKVDAICVPEPLVSRLVSTNGAHLAFTFASAWQKVNQGDPRSPQVSLFASTRNTPSLPVLQALLGRWASAQKALVAQPATATRFAPELKVTPDLVIQGLPNTLLELLPPAQDRSLVESYLKLTGEVSVLPSQEFYALP